MSTCGDLAASFEMLTGHKPLRWQYRLFDRLRRSHGDIPGAVTLPTGLGKTSVIPIWLIALTHQAAERNGKPVLPRRLIYIVNRRTVVDQASDVAKALRDKLKAPDNEAGPLGWLRQALVSLCSDPNDTPLAVSTLRGELADNGEWKTDPARPAIVIGTVDMIGSKLLFSGYGDGRYRRPHHAGLVGQDALIIHDEAHLTPAFSDLLRLVAQTQRHSGEPRSVKVMELSATHRGGNGVAEDEVQLESEDKEDEIVKKRLDATKRLSLHTIDEAQVVKKLVELALAHKDEQTKVLIYVRSPEDAGKIAKKISEKPGKGHDDRVALLTGTIRGYERDQIVKRNPVYRAMLDPESKVEQTVYLVSPSAGEVGIDMDSDHMVCDLTTLDSMIQRLGRVNRGGGAGRAARIDVVAGTKSRGKQSKLEKSIEKTDDILKRWAREANGDIDVSPGALRERMRRVGEEVRRAAFAPKPDVPPLTDILLDERGEAAWSTLSEVIGKNSKLAYRTVVLPVEAGGLGPHGTLDGKVTQPCTDVAELDGQRTEGRGERWQLIKRPEGAQYVRLATGERGDPTLLSSCPRVSRFVRRVPSR